jgi:threonine/homoserine/homoserine lactone efflux protein
MPTAHLPEFVLTVFVLIVIPGPSVLFVVGRGVALGRRAALATVVGNAGGLALQALLVAAGVGSIVQESVTAFTVVKLVGAAYLVLLGLRMIRDRRRLSTVMDAAVEPKRVRRILREGFVVGATNPKGAMLGLLGALCVGIALVSDSSWAIASGSIRLWLARSPRRLELLGGAGGLTLVGLGVKLVVSGRND